MKARIWIALIAAIPVVLVLAHMVGSASRSVQYHRMLKTYSDVLKPGMKRSEIENYFMMTKYVSFDQMCCVGPKRATFDDLVEIAHEKEGWVCRPQIVYAVFQFASSGRKGDWVIDPDDRLVRLSLFRSDCLDLL